MPSEVILPRVDMDMATGRISKWLVGDGTRVTKGQPLFEIETDKAAMEIEAEASGTIRELAEPGGGDLAVGSVVAWIYGEGEPAAPVVAPTPAAPIRAAPAAPCPASPPQACSTATDEGAGRPRATPLARRLARDRGHDLAVLPGTGPRGRVQADDVPARIAPVLTSPPPPDGGAQVAPAPPRPAPGGRPVTTLREGEGTPVVLLHGFGSDTDGWRPFLQGYGGGRPVLALDLPGHGAAPLGRGADFASLVDAVEEALLASRLGAFNLVGHSLGGAVSAAVAARGALDIRSLLLLSPAGLGPEINGAFLAGYLAAASEASLGPWLRELVADAGAVTPAFVRATLHGRDSVLPAQRRLAAALFPDGTQAFTIRADLARLACPVRIVVGTADRIVPARHAEALPGMVALHRLPGVGHLPQVEAREAVQAILAQTTRL